MNVELVYYLIIFIKFLFKTDDAVSKPEKRALVTPAVVISCPVRNNPLKRK